MPHSYTSILVHVVFATKDRHPFLDSTLEERLFPYLGGTVRDLDGTLLSVNGADDHLHLLIWMSATQSIAELVGKIKGCSSKWIHETFPDRANFAWQRGYGAFTVSMSQKEKVIAYINGQKAHHAKVSYRDEFLRLLRAHGIAGDEQLLWK
jgi:REP element-mobilizing transposase RayT